MSGGWEIDLTTFTTALDWQGYWMNKLVLRRVTPHTIRVGLWFCVVRGIVLPPVPHWSTEWCGMHSTYRSEPTDSMNLWLTQKLGKALQVYYFFLSTHIFYAFLPSSVPIGNCISNWTELALFSVPSRRRLVVSTGIVSKQLQINGEYRSNWTQLNLTWPELGTA